MAGGRPEGPRLALPRRLWGSGPSAGSTGSQPHSEPDRSRRSEGTRTSAAANTQAAPPTMLERDRERQRETHPVFIQVVDGGSNFGGRQAAGRQRVAHGPRMCHGGGPALAAASPELRCLPRHQLPRTGRPPIHHDSPTLARLPPRRAVRPSSVPLWPFGTGGGDVRRGMRSQISRYM